MPYDYWFKPTKAIQAKDGIKAQSRARGIWKELVGAEMDRSAGTTCRFRPSSRGRSYARKGQVLSIEETKDGITAHVQGSQRTPYKIKIQITPLTDVQWNRVIDALAEQAIFSAQLLAGEMPREIEQAFEAAKVSLFPSQRNDLKTDCSCPDYANPCKHVAATHYILGERFDEDPFLIFRLGAAHRNR